ncbi:MAG: NADH-quinone oxidoreductase subunit NuoE [Armatimonadota bacterium]
MLAKIKDSEAEELARRYPRRRSAVLPLLWLAQERDGYVTAEAIAGIADALGLTTTEVRDVASFYHMLHLEPVGEHIIELCTNLSCMLRGGEELFQYLQEKLGIGEGETTPDGKFSLFEAECLGYCDVAPMMQINGVVYGNLTEEKVDEILRSLGHEDA